MKRFVILLLTAVLALTMPLSALAAGQIEVTEDISVSDDYDWTRFKGQNVTLNVYNWGEYISNGSDDSVDVVAAFEKLTGIKVNYTALSTIMFVVILSIILISNAMESRGYRRDQRALRGGDVK